MRAFFTNNQSDCGFQYPKNQHDDTDGLRRRINRNDISQVNLCFCSKRCCQTTLHACLKWGKSERLKVINKNNLDFHEKTLHYSSALASCWGGGWRRFFTSLYPFRCAFAWSKNEPVFMLPNAWQSSNGSVSRLMNSWNTEARP